jgi:hypothetical protein
MPVLLLNREPHLRIWIRQAMYNLRGGFLSVRVDPQCPMCYRGAFTWLSLSITERRKATRGGFWLARSVWKAKDIREAWGWAAFERLGQDLRYGSRTLRKSALFSAMAALLLAPGIGANTAIYSVMDAILFRALPVRHPRELAILNWRAIKPPASGFANDHRHEIEAAQSDRSPFRTQQRRRVGCLPHPRHARESRVCLGSEAHHPVSQAPFSHSPASDTSKISLDVTN